ncbi:unnamed protein product, partial [Ilex paraguariensis]
ELNVQDLWDVLSALRQEKLSESLKKFSVMTDSVLFLGYVISKDGISVDLSNVEAIE